MANAFSLRLEAVAAETLPRRISKTSSMRPMETFARVYLDRGLFDRDHATSAATDCRRSEPRALELDMQIATSPGGRRELALVVPDAIDPSL